MNSVTKEIENLTMNEVEEVLASMKHELTFIIRAKHFGRSRKRLGLTKYQNE